MASASNTSLPGQDDPPGRFFIWAGARYIRPQRPFHPAHMAKRDNRRGAESQAPHRRTSSLIGPCISSFPALFRLQRWTEFLPFVRLGATRLGGPCHASHDAALVQILMYFLAFCVWLGAVYLLAMINDALFAIFLGSLMIIGGIYIPPRQRTDGPEHSF